MEISGRVLALAGVGLFGASIAITSQFLPSHAPSLPVMVVRASTSATASPSPTPHVTARPSQTKAVVHAVVVAPTKAAAVDTTTTSETTVTQPAPTDTTTPPAVTTPPTMPDPTSTGTVIDGQRVPIAPPYQPAPTNDEPAPPPAMKAPSPIEPPSPSTAPSG